VCAKKKARDTVKHYWGYADIVPEEAHRRRLLGRISACISRCTLQANPSYHSYGGRGIRVSEEFLDRRAFLAYLITLDGWDQPLLELDRRDVDKGYERGNLRFITKRQNRNNQRTVQDLQRRVDELEARLRHLTGGAA
jgi:hypothetical protein